MRSFLIAMSLVFAFGSTAFSHQGGGRTIVCSKWDLMVGPGAHPYTYRFTPQDCGGRLPDHRHVGMLSKTEVCGVEASWIVLQPGEHGGPGVSFWTIDGCSSGQSQIQVIFVER